MIAIITLLVAFPAGWFLSTRTAFVVYGTAYLWGLSFQSLYLTRIWVGGDTSAFPADPDTLPVSYGVVSATIYAVGAGLIVLGGRLRRRRTGRSAVGTGVATEGVAAR
jgi:hypothetical protein